jgi:hypothetical protein
MHALAADLLLNIPLLLSKAEINVRLDFRNQQRPE